MYTRVPARTTVIITAQAASAMSSHGSAVHSWAAHALAAGPTKLTGDEDRRGDYRKRSACGCEHPLSEEQAGGVHRLLGPGDIDRQSGRDEEEKRHGWLEVRLKDPVTEDGDHEGDRSQHSGGKSGAADDWWPAGNRPGRFLPSDPVH